MQTDLQTPINRRYRAHQARFVASSYPSTGFLRIGRAAVFCALSMMAMPGCRATPPPVELSDLDKLVEEEQHEDPAPVATTAAADEPPQQLPAVSEWKDELQSDSWVRSIVRDGVQPPRRWHHEGLDQLLALEDSPEATLEVALNADNASTRTNAAIGLARLGNPSGFEVLAAAVGNRDLHQRQRQAAAEAFGEIESPQSTAFVLQLIDRLGRFDEQHRAAYHPDLHAELLRSLSDWHDEQVVEVFRQAVAAPGPDSRLVALEAWAAHPEVPLPDRVVSIREDNNPQLRAAALKALTAHRVEGVERYLEKGLRDLDRRVQMAAISGLGTMGTETATDRLRRVMREEPEVFQAAAVDALAKQGDIEAVTLAAENPSWRVRQRAAQALEGFATPAGTQLARKLLTDPSIEVQQRVVESVAQWPLDVAGVVLLEAMAMETYRTRKTAAEHLTRQWPAASAFAVDESEPRRAETLSHLRTQWFTDFGVAVDSPAISQAEQDAIAKHHDAAQEVDPQELQRVQTILAELNQPKIPPRARDQLLTQLIELGPALLPTMERLAHGPGLVVSEDVFTQVLPKISPLYEAIDAVGLEEPIERRAAANRLIELSNDLLDSELAGDRLFEQIIIRNDPLVWRSVLIALEPSSTNATTQIVCAAAGHPSAEIRRRACEHFIRFPAPEHQALLTAALNDSDSSVTLAAISALGAGGQMNDRQPLQWLLRSDNDQVQLAAAIALVQLDDADGLLALQRLATDEDPGIRIEVAHAIGKLGQAKLIPLLIAMLDDRGVVQRAAIGALERLAGEEVTRDIRSEGLESETRLVAAWKNWGTQRQDTARRPATSAQPAGAR